MKSLNKKLWALLLSGAMVFSMAACSSEEDTDSESTASTESTESSEDGDASAYTEELDLDSIVTLGDYKGITVTLTASDYATDDAAVEAEMEDLIDETQPYVEDESATVVGEDDIVCVDYVGSVDGVAFDGGSAEDVMIDVAANASTSGTTFIDGFTDGLAGAEVGSTIDCTVTFPEDYSATDLAGVEAVFTFTINYVAKEVTVDTLTDDYVNTYFSCASVSDFYDYAKETLEAEVEENRESDTRSAVIEAVVANATVEVPEDLLQERLEDYETRYESVYVSEDSTLEEYLSTYFGATIEEFEEQVLDLIEDNVKEELVFRAIAQKEGIVVTNDEFEESLETLMTNGGYSDTSSLFSAYGATEEAGEEYLRISFVCSEAIDFCVENAVVTEE